MQEKERYSYHSYYKKRVCDNETNKIVGAIETLNWQDKEIIKLRKENQQLKIENGTLKEKILIQLQLNADNVNFMENQRRENQQLKQSQKQLAVEELEKLKERIVLNDEYDEYTGHNIINSFELLEDINARIKELKGEK